MTSLEARQTSFEENVKVQVLPSSTSTTPTTTPSSSGLKRKRFTPLVLQVGYGTYVHVGVCVGECVRVRVCACIQGACRMRVLATLAVHAFYTCVISSVCVLTLLCLSVCTSCLSCICTCFSCLYTSIVAQYKR